MTDVSVIITSFNQSEYVGEAIESVLNQTENFHEILILDDASSDNSQKIISAYQEKYPDLITAYYHDENIGVSANRNIGLEESTGEYVTFLDGDNRFLPRKIEYEVERFKQQPDVDIVFSDVYYTDESGSKIGRWCADVIPPTGDVVEEVLTRDWPRGSLFSHPLIKKKLFDETGPFDESLPIYEDWDMYIRMSFGARVEYTGEPLLEYRQLENSLSSSTGPVQELEIMKTIYKKHQEKIMQQPDAEEIWKRINKFLLLKQANVSYFQGKRLQASLDYIRYLNTSKPRTSIWHIKFFLPKALVKILKVAKRKCTSTDS